MFGDPFTKHWMALVLAERDKSFFVWETIFPFPFPFFLFSEAAIGIKCQSLRGKQQTVKRITQKLWHEAFAGFAVAENRVL